MIQKPFRLEQEDIETIQKVKEEYGLKSEAEALRFILRQYRKKEGSINGISVKIFRKIEEMQGLTLDVLNTILIDGQIDGCYPVSEQESKILTELKAYRQERLANLKQRKDYRNKKKGTDLSPKLERKRRYKCGSNKGGSYFDARLLQTQFRNLCRIYRLLGSGRGTEKSCDTNIQLV